MASCANCKRKQDGETVQLLEPCRCDKQLTFCQDCVQDGKGAVFCDECNEQVLCKEDGGCYKNCDYFNPANQMAWQCGELRNGPYVRLSSECCGKVVCCECIFNVVDADGKYLLMTSCYCSCRKFCPECLAESIREEGESYDYPQQCKTCLMVYCGCGDHDCCQIECSDCEKGICPRCSGSQQRYCVDCVAAKKARRKAARKAARKSATDKKDDDDDNKPKKKRARDL